MSKLGDGIDSVATKVWHAIIHEFAHIKEEARHFTPIAVSILQKLKTLEDSPWADVIANALGKDNGAAMLTKAREATAKAIIALDVFNAAGTMPEGATDEEKAQWILSKFKLSDDEAKNAFYHNAASLTISYLSDGKITWSEGVRLSEAYYQAEIASKK